MISSVAGALRTGGTALLELFYPPVCLLCGVQEPGAGKKLCRGCLGVLCAPQGPTCPRCGSDVGPFTHLADGCPSCRNQKLHFDAVIRLGRYEDKLREACLKIKHVEGEPLARELAELLASERQAALEAERADVIVPVPLYWWRRLRRGFNQAEALAARLEKRLKVRVVTRMAWRTRNTLPQAELTRPQRFDNVRGAFAAHSSRRLSGARVLVVDDILTTGATCSELARALKQAGASRVVAVVVAKS